MVVRKTRKTKEASQSSVSTPSSSSKWTIQAPVKVLRVRSRVPTNVLSIPKPRITRQVAINTLAAMEKRYSMPGPAEPNSRPRSELRASSFRSLDRIRRTVQKAVSKEINDVIQKYFERYFSPAIKNIKDNMGEEAVNEDQIKSMCRRMLEATRHLYSPQPKPNAPEQTTGPEPSCSHTNKDKPFTYTTHPIKRRVTETDVEIAVKRARPNPENSETASSPQPSGSRDLEKWRLDRLTKDTHFSMESHAHKFTTNLTKRRETEHDTKIAAMRLETMNMRMNPENTGTVSSPQPSGSKDLEKWNPDRLTKDTHFIMGSHAHKYPTTFTKRKETKHDPEIAAMRLRMNPGNTSSPQPSGMRDPVKWNPDRLTKDTHFIMGSHAHKVLGLGNARGRLYTRHAELLRYPADTVDKEWIANHNLVNAVGGKTYIMILDDIEELAKSEAYRHTSLPMLGELTGFKIPPFMLTKIKAFITKQMSGESDEVGSPQPGPSNQDEDKFKLEDIKIENRDDFDSENFNASEYNVSASDNARDFPEVLDFKEEGDFADIPIKVEDIDDIKVDNIKVEQLDEDEKIDDMEDINVGDIKVEDIKLEADEFDLCKSEDEESNLVEGLLDSDIEFLSRNLGDIESDADARKTIEKLTGANPDTITLVGDEFDLGPTLNTGRFPSTQTTKFIHVASTTSGMVHRVPVAHIATPHHITGNTVHYYTSNNVQTSPRIVHHQPRSFTVQNIPISSPQLIRRIPINTNASFGTMTSQGKTSTIIGFRSPPSTATVLNTPHFFNATSKSFPTGNILHDAIVSRNIINRSSSLATANSMGPSIVQSFNVIERVSAVRSVSNTTTTIPTPRTSTVVTSAEEIAVTKEIIEKTHSSFMLKKVLTSGSAGATKSYLMRNTQKILSTGFASGSAPPPNVTVVSSGISGGASGTLSATHATLSALLASSEDRPPPPHKK